MSKRREIIEKLEKKTTKSTHFLLPMLGYRKSFYTPYLINCYIVQGDKPKLVAVFENSDYEPLIHALHKLAEHPSYNDCEYADDNKEIVLYFDVPTDFILDYRSFLEGKYSWFTAGYKDLLAHLSGRSSGSDYKVTVFDAIYPTEKKRKAIEVRLNATLEADAEVFDAPYLAEETYVPVSELDMEKAAV